MMTKRGCYGLSVQDLRSADHDARVDRLLWSGATRAAERHIAYTSPQRRPAFHGDTRAYKTKSPDAAMRVQEAGVGDT